MKRSGEILALFIANVLVFVFAIAGIILFVQFFECFGAAKRLPHIGSYPVMRVLVYGASFDREGDTVSARISLLDTGGTDFAVIERSWKGSSLSIDFVSARFSGKTVLFPYRIYGVDTQTTFFSGATGKEGTRLAPYFIEHGRCLLFGPETSTQNRRDLYRLCRYAFGQATRIFTRFTGLRTVNLAGCSTFTYYTIYTDFSGHLSLVEG